MNASRRRWAFVGLVVVVAAAHPLGSGLAAGPREPTLEVRVTSGLLSVRASGAPLADVLLAIGREAHLRIVLPGAIDSLVTDEFVNMSLDEAVRRLTRWHSVVLVYGGPRDEAADPLLAEVWVTSAPSNRVADDRSAGSDQFKESTQVQRQETRPGTIRPEQEPDSRPPGLTIALKFGASNSRTQLVEALVREQGEPAAVQILREAATRDPDPRIRRGAIQVLASLNSPDAVDAVQATLRDLHSGVRYEAEMALRRLSRARSDDSAGK
jgi:HEAT repeats